jgi:glyoxylase-like metal-dependent hydrolase (beta-lactamase superfamily II)
VDYVFCTHLHIDHTGWNTKLVDGKWVPTFPNAKYFFHKGDYAAWEKLAAEGVEKPGGAGGVWRMNCEPIMRGRQALLVDEDFEIEPASADADPGHSPCHCCLDIRRGGERAIIAGDMLHHQLQCTDPSLSTIFCWDAGGGAATRRRGVRRDRGTKRCCCRSTSPTRPPDGCARRARAFSGSSCETDAGGGMG